MNKDFGLILELAATVGARMPAAGAAFEINARQSDEGAEQDFSAVILQMEKRAHLFPVSRQYPFRLGCALTDRSSCPAPPGGHVV
jgi:hypothetical protein